AITAWPVAPGRTPVRSQPASQILAGTSMLLSDRTPTPSTTVSIPSDGIRSRDGVTGPLAVWRIVVGAEGGTAMRAFPKSSVSGVSARAVKVGGAGAVRR